MVGSSVCRLMTGRDYAGELLWPRRDQLDLPDINQVDTYFQKYEPDAVVVAAAKVDGIHAKNSYPKEFLSENVHIASNVIESAYHARVERLIFLGSSCIYPGETTQPIVEEQLLTGRLEPTNEAYAVAKIAGLKLCESHNKQCNTDYRSLMPTNLYGPNDNYHPTNSHVISALISRFHCAVVEGAKEVVIWGTGSVYRDFLHVDDLSCAIERLLLASKSEYQRVVNPNGNHITVGSGGEISISAFADIIAAITGFKGKVVFDPSKPDGTPRKILNIEKAKSLGWLPSISLKSGLESTYKAFLAKKLQ